MVGLAAARRGDPAGNWPKPDPFSPHSDSGPAYDNFAAAWQSEAKTLEAALHEFADKVGISQRKYESADHETILALHSAGAGVGLTTMPAPAAAHPGTTTGLTPGTPPPSLADFD
ncbi:hypothetical protein [Streptomyces guryensis]|uniref:Uncharacterized protein n=1 Tax=Streptomyces guryensis TaxID=2886947 RepID=A0A9Q3VYY1_9ACTN|nr:hypothetical protein [Streptomyces guryensis]MCD9880732.1 hypothetical protein [Streptomyces guryensis]